MKLKVILSFLGVMGLIVSAFSQQDTLYIEKRKCNLEFDGYKLIIHYKDRDSVYPKMSFSYSLEYLQRLSDEEKLLIVGKLLEYASDTSTCCKRSTTYNFNGVDMTRGVPYDVKRYSISIEALFMINRIVWPKLTEWYSSGPVLYDVKKAVTINDNPKAISKFVKDYKHWYRSCIKLGYIPKKFPFNKGRYTWFGGRIDINEPTGRKGIFDQ